MIELKDWKIIKNVFDNLLDSDFDIIKEKINLIILMEETKKDYDEKMFNINKDMRILYDKEHIERKDV